MGTPIIKNARLFIIISTLVVGICSITYELLISTISSYFLGDSVYHFSMTIGFYLASMGLGSYLSRYGIQNPYRNFILIEFALGVIGTICIPVLYYCFAVFPLYNFYSIVLFFIISIGVLTGFEIPLLTKILDDEVELRVDNLSDILTFDYIGALASTILFPIFFIPYLGLFKTSIFFGSLNLLVGLLMAIVFVKMGKLDSKVWRNAYFIVLIINLIFFTQSARLIEEWQTLIYRHPVVFQTNTPYQDIVMTQQQKELRLYLNGTIQFSSRDEYRYHEALIHVPIIACKEIKNVLILGGGEGLALRELLKYPSVEHVDLVELDPKIIELSKEFGALKELNDNSMVNTKLDVHIEDAFAFVNRQNQKYDLIIADLPDPTSDNLSRLYSDLFYSRIISILNDEGIFVTQATNPSLTSQTYWCIEKTLKHVGFKSTLPYKAYVPSFGEWGFILASKKDKITLDQRKLSEDLKFIDESYFRIFDIFSKDVMSKRDRVDINQIDHPTLHHYYEEEFGKLLEMENKL